jgi:hypothetical protein
LIVCGHIKASNGDAQPRAAHGTRIQGGRDRRVGCSKS